LNINLPSIIRGCRDNDRHSQELLYKFCYPDMIKLCYRYAPDADSAGSIFNDAMLKVFRSLDTYKDEGKLRAWIKRIVVNCCIDFCRKKSVFSQILSAEQEPQLYIKPEAFDLLSAKEIQLFIKQLPPCTAVVFNMHLYEGYTHKQIGEILGISEGTSKWHVSEAKQQLRKKIEKLNPTLTKVNAAG
jgi:RNA polymerase sigma-70 factor, ECF subfamily